MAVSLHALLTGQATLQRVRRFRFNKAVFSKADARLVS